MKNIFKLMMLALLVIPFQGCSDDDEASMPIVMGQGADFSIPMEVTPNNLAGIWKLQSWSGSNQHTPVVYLELIRRDRKYYIYENYSSMYPRLITGTYSLESDYYKGTILKGKYDHASGNWNNDYIVALYANSMILTVDGDAGEVQVFVRVNEVPAEIKDAALSPVGSEE